VHNHKLFDECNVDDQVDNDTVSFNNSIKKG